MGSVIVPAVWIGQEMGRKDGAQNPGIKKKGKGGDTSITCAPSDPALPLSLHGQTCCLRGGALFPQAHAHPPPLFEIAFAPFSERRELNCNNLPSDVSLLYFQFQLFFEKKNMKGKTDARFTFDQGTWRYRIKDIQQNREKRREKKKEKQQITRAAPSHTSSRLHAAVILYFAAPGCAHTVSDRDWCKINTSQECDVLIKSLCCSDREARRVRGGLPRRPLWSCQVWPSKADEAVRLLIC